MLPVALAAMPTVPVPVPVAEPGQSQSQAEAAKIPTGPGGLGALQAPQSPGTKHKPVVGATTVSAWAFLNSL